MNHLQTFLKKSVFIKRNKSDTRCVWWDFKGIIFFDQLNKLNELLNLLSRIHLQKRCNVPPISCGGLKFKDKLQLLNIERLKQIFGIFTSSIV